MITSTYRSWGEAMALGSRIRQRYRCEVQHISPDSAESAGAVGLRLRDTEKRRPR